MRAEGGHVASLKHLDANLYAFKPDTSDTPSTSPAEQLFEQALVAQYNSDPEEELNLYRQAIVADPNHASSWVNMGTLYFHRQNFVEAIYCYRRAIDIDPSYALPHYNLANLMDEIGIQNVEVVAYYQKAIELNPRYGDAYFNLASLYAKRGEVLPAIRHWEKYLEVGADQENYWLQTARCELKRLRALLTVQGGKSADSEPNKFVSTESMAR